MAAVATRTATRRNPDSNMAKATRHSTMKTPDRSLLRIALAGIISLCVAAAAAAQPAIFKRFLGTWQLVEFAQYSLDGETLVRPMIGRLVYDSAGGVAAQLMPTDRVPAPPGASAEDSWLANRRYTAYFGVWSLTPKEERITHTVEGSLLQDWIGQELHRYYEFPADNILRLSLKRDGKVVSSLTWRKLEN